MGRSRSRIVGILLLVILALAAGGDGFDTFLEGTNPVYGDPVVDVVAGYVGSHSPVHPQREGRIARQ